MSASHFQQVVINAWPQGMPKTSDFRLEEKPLRDLEDGEALVRITYLSPDPYMRGVMAPVEHRFFLVDEWREESQTATDQLVDWVKADRIRYRETIAEGLATAPEAFTGLLEGKNLGKQLVKLS